VHRWCTQLDAIQPSSTKHQEGALLVCYYRYCPSTASAAAICMQLWAGCHHFSTTVRDLEVYMHWRWPQHDIVVSRSADCRSLRCRLASVSDDQFQGRFIGLWLLPLCCQSWTTVTLHWLAFLPTNLIACSPCSTLQLDQSLVFVARLTSQTLLPVSTGYVLPSELSSNWRSLYTELFTGLRLGTCLISWVALLTCRLRVVFGRQFPANLLSDRRLLSQLANDHLLCWPKAMNSLPDDVTSA